MNTKPVYILGISAFYHDSAAALLRDGEIIAAAQEERFSRKKHDNSFPRSAIDFCLKQANIKSQDLDNVAFHDNSTAILNAFLRQRYIQVKLNCRKKPVLVEHHRSHASSAFFPSPFKDAAILTIDESGERTTSFGIGRNNDIKILAELKFPHSLGFLYSAFTGYIGFKPNSEEYKLMGLAPYGEPLYVDLIKRELVDIKDNGSFRINLKYFSASSDAISPNENFFALFGGQPRRHDAGSIEQKHMDIARSIQAVTEEIVLKMAAHARKETGMENLCMAGGVALNCVASGKILRQKIFKNIWIQPAATDSGGALGAALYVWHTHLKKPRAADGFNDSMKSAFLGPEFSDDDIEAFLLKKGADYQRLMKDEIANRAAFIIAKGEILGWFQGRMEYGPRALGNRSILADPRFEEKRAIINSKVKFREPFRPFAPSVLAEQAPEYFEFDSDSPYMLLVAPVKDDKRSSIPAVTHIDNSARVQTIRRESNPLYYDVLDAFSRMTGCGVLINTSFNVKGEPIVCTPEDAYNCFLKADMNYLIMGSFLLSKKKVKEMKCAEEVSHEAQ